MRITIASILALAATPAIAEIEPSTSAEIEAAIAGNTVESEIDGAGAGDTVDYFAEDGEMRNADWGDETWTWTVEDDALCMDFGKGSDCWELAIDGDSITWLREGAPAGTGEIREGNPEGL